MGNSWCLSRQTRGGRLERADRHHSGPSDQEEASALGTGEKFRGRGGRKAVQEKVLSSGAAVHT